MKGQYELVILLYTSMYLSTTVRNQAEIKHTNIVSAATTQTSLKLTAENN